MNAEHRRKEIISILVANGHITQRQLAWEFDVSIRTIQHDVVALSLEYPIYTKPGTTGGIFILESYKPYNNTLTQTEQDFLCRLHEKAVGNEKEILSRIIHKYGAYRLEI